MKNHVMALAAMLASVAVPVAPTALAYHCSPEPQCCPTVAHCWAKGAYVVQGSGTSSPGLGTTPEPQSMSFTGTATVVGPDGVGVTYSCHWGGSDLAGSTVASAGALSGSCGPIAFNCQFVRVAAAFEMACTDGGAASGVFRPHNTNPTTSYDLTLVGMA